MSGASGFATGLAGPEGPEPHSGLGASRGIPDAAEHQVFGDWRDLRAALERASPEWASADQETRQKLWDFAEAVIAQYAPAKAQCRGCGTVLHARSAYRCADCRAHYCEACIHPHFGLNHRSHA